MAIAYPVALNAASAVRAPIGTATREALAVEIASRHLAALLPATWSGAERDAYRRAVRCSYVSSWAPGRWHSREAVERRWQAAIDAHWAEALAMTDRTWRLGIRYFRVTPAGSALDTRPDLTMKRNDLGVA